MVVFGMDKIDRKIAHLLHRMGFGFSPADIRDYGRMRLEDAISRMFSDSRKIQFLTTLPDPRPEEGEVSNLGALKLILRSREDLRVLNSAWLDRMARTPAFLREKMTFFWHDHFATNVPFAYLMQVQNNTLRKHALGSFRELLHAMAKDPAMIIYLNNQQNKKKHPNENFAREVMELFTLGEGHYSENDIKEAARAFTGFQVDMRGEFRFNADDHDDGEKTFLGKTGRFRGEDIIEILLEQERTAYFIAEKMYHWFVNAEQPDQEIISVLAGRFRDSGYQIGDLLLDICSSSFFYEEKNMGVRVKSPVELIASQFRLLRVQPKRPKPVLQIQRALGQVLFFPPNVAGWRGGRAWIDASSMLLRMKLPLIFYRGAEHPIGARVDFEDQESEAGSAGGKRFMQRADWKSLYKALPSELNREQRIEYMMSLLLTTPHPDEPGKILSAFGRPRDVFEEMRDITAVILSCPEYQLC